MTHQALVELAVRWLRTTYRCGIILSEQACCTGEVPDVIGWKGRCRSVLVECKISRADFLADRGKPWRLDAQGALGCERFYMAPAGLIAAAELPPGWGLLEVRPPHHAQNRRVPGTPGGRKVEIAVACNKRKSLRTPEGLLNEMNLLLASLRRVEIRIEPQTITDFLKWENRLARYNGGTLPQGVDDPAETNGYLRV
ncbi:MAG: hypothetical protein ACHP9S_03275 [Terriglobales bacterium]|jgi:hypothetical protein